MIELLREQRETASHTDRRFQASGRPHQLTSPKLRRIGAASTVVELAEIGELYGVKLQTLLKAAEIE